MFFEVHIALLGDGDEMDVGMRHFQSDDSHTYALARHGFLDGLGHFLGKDHHAADFVILKVEDVVVFAFRNHQGMAFGDGIDVHEGKKAVVFSNFVARDFPFHDS